MEQGRSAIRTLAQIAHDVHRRGMARDQQSEPFIHPQRTGKEHRAVAEDEDEDRERCQRDRDEHRLVARRPRTCRTACSLRRGGVHCDWLLTTTVIARALRTFMTTRPEL